MPGKGVPCGSQRDDVVFGGRDIRKEYGGPGINKTTGTGLRCSAKFNKPLRRPSDSASVSVMDSTGSCGGANNSANGVENVEALSGGEKEKSAIKKPSDGSASSGAGSSGANSEVDVLWMLA